MATSNNGLLLLLLCIAAPLFLLSMAAATQFRVGGPMGWTVPAGPNEMSYNQWAQKSRFKIGDSLLFVYQAGDSVLQVSQDGYNTCNTSSYIHKFDDNGNTAVFALDHSGPYYFISGVKNNCIKKESLVVVVLSDRTGSTSSSSLPPSPSMASPPPPSTPSEVSPPSTSTTSPPPPPPPAPSPSTPPSKNGASLKVVGFLGTFGALVLGSLLFL